MIKKVSFIKTAILLISLMTTSCTSIKNDLASSDSINNDFNAKNPTIGSTVVIGNDIDLKESPSSSSTIVAKLNKGNLVKIMDIKNSWAFVQAVCFVPPASKGYIPIESIRTNFKDVIPNQGFIKGAVRVFTRPDNTSEVSATDVTGAVSIFKREREWAYCRFVGGLEDGWIEELEIQYNFPLVN